MKKRIVQALCLLIVLSLLISTPFSAEKKNQYKKLHSIACFFLSSFGYS